MSDIAPLNGPSAASYLPTGKIERPAASSTDVSRGSDQIELSDTAKILAKLADIPEVREDLVARVRAEIANGTYESDAKLNAAIEGLAQDLG
ncbi:flagellar biosynthesis anti-sigma factor FlgM [Algisphaera agarilytica]|uniref:Negative regulator of flagellin synthesis n=1 Tax=Algisphaera agarilytica TaxID=1385975 RepID=A0A7X0H5W5_9BACT|nr:flagellar biosynthesis anti-sigma factor FlgM [Algisphaera agarilytica]MBB6429718.1 negative regulator of flagellin synthesis FlgM [Algisphaera agarilytica]